MATYANPTGNPNFGAPGYDPNLGNQGFAAPNSNFGAPGYDPNLGNQGFAAPNYGNAGFGNQGFNPGAAPLQVQQGYDSPQRMDWRNPQPAASWGSMPQERQDRKMRELSAGGELADANDVFPDSRPCKDCFFGMLFVLVAAGCMGYAAFQIPTVEVLLAQMSFPPLTLLGGGVAAGTGAAFFAAVVYMLLMGRAPACVVWVSLIMGPVIMMAIGAALLVYLPGQGLVFGGIMMAMGLCMLACVFVCWRQFIPFTIEVVKVLSTVMQENPAMLVTAGVCGLFGLGWSVGVFVTALAVAANYGESSGGQIDQNLVQMVAIPFVFVFFWGVQVAYYYSHTVLCGVFGRWYYKKDIAAPVCSSLKVASTTSFGSISMAAFIVAAIRTLEFVLRQLRNDAAEEGNIVMTVVLVILECIVSCIGDIMEWFSEWALVQVAVRGTGFFDSAKITYSMATSSNMELIIADLLVDSVATLASLICAGAGAAAGAALMYFSGDASLAGGGAVLGLLPGLMVGNAAGSLVTSGSKTILMSWAEKPEELTRLYPDIAEVFAKKTGPFGS